MQAYPLTVKAITEETENAKTVTFAVPTELKEKFAYKQGQYLTLKFELKGNEERRAYSISSSPTEEDIAVTVKRVKLGLVSNYINDSVKVGDRIEVFPPEGRFYTHLEENANKTYYFFAAGSGITPVFSIIKTILEQEPKSTVNLLYGNRNEKSIIFKEDLEQLEKRYAGQLKVVHTLTQPIKERPTSLLIIRAFQKAKITWKGQIGRIDERAVNKFLEENKMRSKTAEYFICGPGEMIDTAEKALLRNGVNASNIHTERFATKADAANSIKGADGAKVKVILGGEEHNVVVPSNKTVLDALIAEKIHPPYSCCSGACSTCMAKVTKGDVRMDVCYALDDDEVANGYVLTCQSHPISEEAEINYDV